MKLNTLSAHVDTFTRENLPPREQWPEFISPLPELAYAPALNCATELLDRHIASGGGARRCMLTDGEEWTYADLLKRSNQIAHALVDEMGLVPGNRVLLRGPNNPWLVASWFGVIKAGGVAVTTMPLLRSRELTTMIEIAEIEKAICDHRFVEDLDAAAPGGFQTFTYGASGQDDLTQVAARKNESFKNVATAADDVCMLAFTSGTTGKPKSTMHFHRDVLAIADTFSRHLLEPVADDLFAASPPLGFTFGLGQSVVFPLRAGASVYLIEQPTPKKLLEAVERHRITVLATAPTAYRAMLADLPAADVSSLRACVSAGETLPKATWEAVHEACGLRIIDGIGSTEMLHIFLSNRPGEVRYGTTGVPVPGYDIRLVDEDGKPTKDGEIGELQVAGPTSAAGYWNNRSKSRETFLGAWTRSGDKYTRDAQGYYTYGGRADDMLKVSGMYVSPFEVEAALMTHADVLEAAVIGRADDQKLTKPKAFVVLKPGKVGSPALAEALQAHVKSRLAPYKYPRWIEFVGELPKTATGKIQRFKLRERDRK